MPVETSEDIVLDFSGLFEEPPEKQAPEMPVEPRLDDGEYKTLSEEKKPVEGLQTGVEGQQAITLYLEAKKQREDHQRSLEVYRTYQENIRKSELLQSSILKGVAAGEDVYSLFLQAVKCISLMTSDELFYRQTEADLKAIYGRGLQLKPPLQMELRETEERLQRLIESQKREYGSEDGNRISRAVRAHREKIAELEGMIQRAG